MSRVLVLGLLPYGLACAVRMPAPASADTDILAAVLSHVAPQYEGRRMLLEARRAPFRDEYARPGQSPPGEWETEEIERIARAATERSGATLDPCDSPCEVRPGEIGLRVSIPRPTEHGVQVALDEITQGEVSGGLMAFVLDLEPRDRRWVVTEQVWVMARDWSRGP